EEETVHIGVGVDREVKTGTVAEIYRQTEPIIHPVTGENLGSPKVKVAEIDLDRRRIGLSLKALSSDPWDDVASRYQTGQEVKGTVAKVADFGVFVDLEPGVTALLPASESGVPKGKPLTSSFKPGQEVTLKVLRVEPHAQKMALTTRDDVRQGEGAPRRGPGGRRGDGPGRGQGRGGRSSVAWSDPGEQTTTEEGKAVGSLGALLMAALDKPDKK
ncbi:MAG: S1 RNA-binding domain-containing protein, partial [Myxococcota bacterium]|nr:S1 RNA-binding domain-containing protein [Myxococcota bacterium]